MDGGAGPERVSRWRVGAGAAGDGEPQRGPVRTGLGGFHEERQHALIELLRLLPLHPMAGAWYFPQLAVGDRLGKYPAAAWSVDLVFATPDDQRRVWQAGEAVVAGEVHPP